MDGDYVWEERFWLTLKLVSLVSTILVSITLPLNKSNKWMKHQFLSLQVVLRQITHPSLTIGGTHLFQICAVLPGSHWSTSAIWSGMSCWEGTQITICVSQFESGLQLPSGSWPPGMNTGPSVIFLRLAWALCSVVFRNSAVLHHGAASCPHSMTWYWQVGRNGSFLP